MKFEIPRSTLYYHLSTIEDNGIIEMTGYKEVGVEDQKNYGSSRLGKGIDLISGEIFKE